jgi:hypothetical protein
MRLFVGVPWIGGIIGLSGTSPAVLALRGASARLARVPIDLGLRLVFHRRRLALAGDLGAAAAILITDGLGVPGAVRSVSVELGLRAAVGLEWWLHRRVAPFVSFQTVILPRPHDLVLLPAGTVGTTPSVWLAGLIGVSVALR